MEAAVTRPALLLAVLYPIFNSVFGKPLASLCGAVYDPLFFLDNLFSLHLTCIPPRSSEDNIDMKLILPVITSPEYDLPLLHGSLKNISISRVSIFRGLMQMCKTLEVQSFPHIMCYEKYSAQFHVSRLLPYSNFSHRDHKAP